LCSAYHNHKEETQKFEISGRGFFGRIRYLVDFNPLLIGVGIGLIGSFLPHPDEKGIEAMESLKSTHLRSSYSFGGKN